MIKGTLRCDFGGKTKDVELNECDMVFVVGIKPLKSGTEGNCYTSQNVILGGMKSSDAIQCLAESMVSQLIKLGDGDAAISFRTMQHFKEIVDRCISNYMIQNIVEILGGKEKMDGGSMES